jgi:hypothetical protein
MIQFWAGIDLVQSAECNVDAHHPENGGYFIEGINGFGTEVDLNNAKRKMTNSTWATGIEYLDGSLKYCEGSYCSETCKNDGCPQTIQGHTCSMIRFCYEADSGSDVWLMPDEKALQQCDFSSATQICDTGGGSGEDCCNYKVELDADLKAYFFASKEGCGEGQRAVVTVNDYNDVGDACFTMGLGSSRINACTCNYEDRDMSSLSEPCHSQFVAGCNFHSPDLGDDTSCCDDSKCVGKHQDVTHPIGLALEIERKLLCIDDIPGRCLNEGIFDCCASQCSGCGADVTPFTEWSQCTSGNATAGTGTCGFGGHGGAFSAFECDFTKCTEDHMWHMGGEMYNNWMKKVDPDNYVAPTVDDETPNEAPGACYDMGSHTCGCKPNECNADLCAASSGSWSARCPDHCKECGAEVTEQAVTEQAKEEEHSGSHDKENHGSHDEENHGSHDHSEHTDMEEESSASVNMMHGLTVAISFGMLISLS